MPRTVHDPVRTRLRNRPANTLAAEVVSAGEVIAPNAWMGECGCIIGPFPHRHVAEAFANAMVEFGQFEVICERVILHADAFYVQAIEVCEEPRVLA